MEKLYYADLDSPLGTAWAATTEVGLFQLDFGKPESVFLESLRKRIKAEVTRDQTKLDPLRKMMGSYFRGEKVDFELSFDLRGTEFQKDVWHAIHRIPYGKLSSYGRLASEVGKPRAARAVGNAVGDNPLSIVIPCHRVVHSDGGLGGYGGGLPMKRYLLGIEGVLPRIEKCCLEEPHLRSRKVLVKFFK